MLKPCIVAVDNWFVWEASEILDLGRFGLMGGFQDASEDVVDREVGADNCLHN